MRPPTRRMSRCGQAVNALCCSFAVATWRLARLLTVEICEHLSASLSDARARLRYCQSPDLLRRTHAPQQCRSRGISGRCAA